MDQGLAPVYEGIIEVRVGSGHNVLGNDSYVIGLYSSWRSYERSRITEKFKIPISNAASKNTNLPFLYYNLSAGEEQTYIVPNYRYLSNGVVRDSPAGPFSIVVNLSYESPINSTIERI
jgi:hypothetical protein